MDAGNKGKGWMAATHVTWFGIVVEFDHSEITQIVTHINTGSAGLGAVATVLIAMGITGPAAVIAGIASAVLKVSATALQGCNSKGIGIFLFVLWVGAPWCRSR
jgi:hypothetical protein